MSAPAQPSDRSRISMFEILFIHLPITAVFAIGFLLMWSEARAVDDARTPAAQQVSTIAGEAR
jgi:hypothetical protein